MSISPGVDLAFGFFLRHSVALLKLACELVLAAGDDVKILVSDFAPLLLRIALELLPIAFNAIPIPGYPLVCSVGRNRKRLALLCAAT